MTSKSELVELIQSHPDAPIAGTFAGASGDIRGAWDANDSSRSVFSEQIKKAENIIHNINIKGVCNPRIQQATRFVPKNDTAMAIHTTDVSDVEFHHLCKLFVQNKSPESIIFWLATWALCKNEITPYIQTEILHFENDDTVAQIAYALAYHINWPHRWELFDAKIKHWRTSSRHAAHFVYVYQMMVDPTNKGDEGYEAFIANNREGLFHATPYLGRTKRTNEAIENALYDLYQETGKKFLLDYARELLKQDINPVEHFRHRVGEDAAHVISTKVMQKDKKNREEWLAVAADVGKSETIPTMEHEKMPSLTLGDILDKHIKNGW